MTLARLAPLSVAAGAYLLAAANVWGLGAEREYGLPLAAAAWVAGCGLLLLGARALGFPVRSSAAGVACAAAAAAAAAHLTSAPSVLAAEIPGAAALLARLVDGAHGTPEGVAVETGCFVLHVVPTLGAAGLPFWTAFAAALVGARAGLGAEGGRSRRESLYPPALIAVGAVAAWVAAVALCVVDDERNVAHAAGFDHVGDTRVIAALGAWVPLLLASVTEPPRPSPAAARRAAFPRDAFAALVVASAASATLALGADLWVAERVAGPLRILVDDSHSGTWERSDRRFDLETFGDSALYNYGAATELLAREHDVRIHRTGPITAELLRGTHVFVVKTPSERFEESEAEAMRSWVREGGGLVLLGDHTNLFGMNEKLNRLLDGVGIEFQGDSVNDATGKLSVLLPAWRTTKGPWLGLGRTQFLTSCSLRLGARAEGLVQLSHALCDRADYGRDSYFGDLHEDGDEFVGPVWVVARAPLGKGRVVCFADSTVFSNFTLFEPGHDRALRALVESAAGVPYPKRLAWVVCLAAVALASGAFAVRGLLGAAPGARSWPDVAAAAVLGLGGALLVVPLLAEAERRDRVAGLTRSSGARMFLPASHSQFLLLPAIGNRRPEHEPLSVSTLLVTVLRGGVVPCILQQDEPVPELRAGDSILLVRPVLSAGSAEELRDVVGRARAAGSRVYIVPDVGPGATGSVTALAASGLLERPAADAAAAGGDVVDVTGHGRTWLWSPVAVCDQALGHCFEVPSPAALATMRSVVSSLPASRE